MRFEIESPLSDHSMYIRNRPWELKYQDYTQVFMKINSEKAKKKKTTLIDPFSKF